MSQSFYFPSADRNLLGVLHGLDGESRAERAALVCVPFGQEAIQGHRMSRLLCTALCRAGIPALRFDYSGTGDSSGDTESRSLDCFVEDIASASAELAIRTRCREVVLIGLRLGANLALLAAAGERVRPQCVIQWDPILDGARYLQEMAAAHTRYLATELGETWVDSSSAQDERREVLGFEIPDAFAARLGQLRYSDMLEGVRQPVIVLAGSPRPAGVPASIAWEHSPKTDWLSDELMNAALFPAQTLAAVVRAAGAR